MTVRTTRTLNPLPFQDLEPHRFEDLVRQLAYSFRDWKTIEPTGRLGADDGMDIRAIEPVFARAAERDESGELEDEVIAERTWIFQCKRERQIGPKRLAKSIAESLAETGAQPYGFVLAAACDFSKKSRDVFRAEMVSRGIEEFFLWGKADLEDMLFQPQNDPLLFAYFNLSLQTRRRSLKTQLRSVIAIKRQIITALDKAEGGIHDALVLVRDPNEAGYPRSRGGRRWRLCKVEHARDPAGLLVVWHEYLAWIAPDQSGWDAWEQCDFAEIHAERGLPHDSSRWERARALPSGHQHALDFWEEFVPEEDQAWLHKSRIIPFDRVLAVDALGDNFYPVPHLFVEFLPEHGPLHPDLQAQYFNSTRDPQFDYSPLDNPRVSLFPQRIPERLYPPPAAFTHSLSKRAKRLAGPVAEELDSLVDAYVKHAPFPTPDPDPQPRTRDFRQFQEWCAGVATPTLSGFAKRLNGTKCRARLATREALPKGEGAYWGSSSLELRVQVTRSKSPENGYWHSGCIRFTATVGDAGSVNVSWHPRHLRETRTSRSAHAPTRRDLQDLTAAELSSEVCEFLRAFLQPGT